jgi:hypothetical protein
MTISNVSGLVCAVILFICESVAVCFGDPLPLGTITVKAPRSCPAGYTCIGIEIYCPGLSKIDGLIAEKPSLTTPRGLLLLMPPARGTQFYDQHHPKMVPVIDELRAEGFVIVQFRGISTWINSAPGNEAGAAHVACRPSTVIRFVYDNYYVPLGLQPGVIGQAGFAVHSTSGGANTIGYALSHYGLDDIIDVAIPSGGPTFATLAKSCMNYPEDEDYWVDISARNIIDGSFGYFTARTGPCYFQNPDYVPRWLEEAVATGGSDYYHPETRVHFVIGAKDALMTHIAGDYYANLVTGGSPLVTFELVTNTPHKVTETSQGRNAIKDAILKIP